MCGWAVAEWPWCGTEHAEVTPEWVWVIGEPGVTAELPQTASEKVMKHVLRRLGKELFRKNIVNIVT